jgi:hypothetical protein
VTAPMPTFPAVAEPTPAQKITALEATANRLLDERNAAVTERDKANARADVHKAIANTALARLEQACTDLRRAHQQCRDLAAANEALTQQNKRLRGEANHDDPTRRWPFKRVGNQL